MENTNALQGVTTADVVNMLNVTYQNNEQTNTSKLKELGRYSDQLVPLILSEALC